MTTKKVSIIIPHRNQPTQLRKCLARLLDLGYDEHEIILVDNQSSPFPLFASEFPIRILRIESPPSPYAARNAGIEQASHPVIALLDVNALVEAGWMENALGSVDSKTILSGKARRIDPGEADIFQRFDYLHSVLDSSPEQVHTSLPAGNLFFYKKAWERIGPFREVRSLGDMEWTSRAFRMGYRLVVHPGVEFTYPFKTGKSFATKYRRLGGGHAENQFHRHPAWYILKNLLPPSPDFIRRMNKKNIRENMGLNMLQIAGLCYWVKINYAIGFLQKLR